MIASEASYHQSLSILVEHFMGAPELSDSLPEGRRILDKQQRHVLFSNLPAVWEVATQCVFLECSLWLVTQCFCQIGRFHEALQERKHQNVKIDTVCDIIQEFVRLLCKMWLICCEADSFCLLFRV